MTIPPDVKPVEYDVSVDDLRDSLLPGDGDRESEIPPVPGHQVEKLIHMEAHHSEGQYLALSSLELVAKIHVMEETKRLISQEPYQSQMFGKSADETLNQLRCLFSRSLFSEGNKATNIPSENFISPMGSDSYSASCVVKNNVTTVGRKLNQGYQRK